MGSVNPRLAYATNKVMSQHYPERLGYVLLVNTPWLFSATWTACKTFMDSETVAKIIFVKVWLCRGQPRQYCDGADLYAVC